MTLEISKNRFNGYKDALKRHGIECDEKLALFCDNRSDAEAITPELLKKDNDLVAFFGFEFGVKVHRGTSCRIKDPRIILA